MLELNDAQRGVLADKLADVANIAVGALLFGQFLGDGPFSPSLAAVGVGIWVFLVGCAVGVTGRRRR
jgi:hypothetical protein